jgi:outer membrane receptor for ferrienterochelin and colicin
LKPERSRAFDLGIEQRFGSSGPLLSLTGFGNDLTDLVDFTAQLFRLVNRSQAATRGLELAAELPEIDHLRLGTSFSYLAWHLQGTSEPLRDTPHWIGAAHASWNAARRLHARVGGTMDRTPL